MPAIYLLRHGQASFGSDDYDVLSDLGARQAAVAGVELARRGLRDPVILSGSLNRQVATARIAAAELGGEPDDVDDRWNELDAHALVDARLGGPGGSRGLTSTAFQEHLDQAMRTWIGEDQPSWRAFSGGAADALAGLASGLPRGADAVVVTSAGVIAALAGRLLGTGAEGIIALNRVSVNASITTIAASPRRLSLLTFNDHAHVAADRTLLTYR